MSGIAAVYHLDHKPVDSKELGRMSERLAARGPDAAGAWIENHVGLAHRLLRVTPESHRERQPIIDPNQRVSLVWDGRLDNRDELLDALQGDTDPDLALAAYRRWGVACVDHLLGEFAFVLWDARHQRLFAARDRMGLRPLHYGTFGSMLLISSDIKPILALLDTAPEPDEALLLAFLTREFRDEDHHRSFFHGIQRLPPGFTLTVEAESLRLRRYWALDLRHQLRLSRQEEYVERFRDLFDQAIRSCVRSASPIACLFSGGLDSSAVLARAARIATVPVEPYMSVGTDPHTDERRHAGELLARLGLTLHELPIEPGDPLAGLEQDLRQAESPLVGVERHNSHMFFDQLRANQFRTVITGTGGDQLLDEYGYFADLLLKRPWRFLPETRAFARWYGTYPSTLSGLALRHLIPSPMKYWGKYFLGRVPPCWLNRDFARRAGLKARLRTSRLGYVRPHSFVQAESYLAVQNAYRVLVFEVMERVTASAQCEMRHPFLDSRLVEFVLAVPWQFRTAGGRRKYLLCEAMAGEVPTATLTRRGKGDYSSVVDEALDRLCRDPSPPWGIAALDRLSRYVDLRGARRLREDFLQGKTKHRWFLWSLIVLDRWLALWGRTQDDASEDMRKAVHAVAT